MISCTVHQSKILGLHTWLLLSIAYVLDVSVVCLDMVVQLIMVFLDILDLDMVVQLVVVFLNILDLDKVVQLVTDFLNIYYIQFV